MARPVRLRWTRRRDRAVADESGVVVVGWTTGALDEAGASGNRDAFVRRYTADGAVSWTSQFGTAGSDAAMAVAVGGPDAAVYVAGQVAGTGQLGETPFSAFVRKYTADGKEVWTREFGAEGASATTTAASVAVDATGAVYVTGWVFGSLVAAETGAQDDAFVRKYDTDGTEVWTHQIGGPGHDLATGVTVGDAGDIYVAGQSDLSSGDVGSTFVRMYRPDGAEVWTRQIGAVNDVTVSVTVDGAGAVYQVGEAFPPERVHSHAQSNHRGVPFVRKYDTDGTESWTEQFGTAATDAIVKVAVDAHRHGLRVRPHQQSHPRRHAEPPLDRLRQGVRRRRGDGGCPPVRQRRTRHDDRRGGRAPRRVLRSRVEPRCAVGDDRQRSNRRVHRQGAPLTQRTLRNAAADSVRTQ